MMGATVQVDCPGLEFLIIGHVKFIFNNGQRFIPLAVAIVVFQEKHRP